MTWEYIHQSKPVSIICSNTIRGLSIQRYDVSETQFKSYNLHFLIQILVNFKTFLVNIRVRNIVKLCVCLCVSTQVNMAFGILLFALMLFISNSDATTVFCDFKSAGGCFTDSHLPIQCFNLRKDYVTFLHVQKVYNVNVARTAKFNPKNYTFFRVVQKFEMPPSTVQVKASLSSSSVSRKPKNHFIRSITSRTNINEQQIKHGSGLYGSWCALRADIEEKAKQARPFGLCCKSCWGRWLSAV